MWLTFRRRTGDPCQGGSTLEPVEVGQRDSSAFVDDKVQTRGAEDSPIVFEVRARKAFGFGKGARFSQTRWRFR
jgi:hypothetical protein